MLIKGKLTSNKSDSIKKPSHHFIKKNNLNYIGLCKIQITILNVAALQKNILIQKSPILYPKHLLKIQFFHKNGVAFNKITYSLSKASTKINLFHKNKVASNFNKKKKKMIWSEIQFKQNP